MHIFFASVNCVNDVFKNFFSIRNSLCPNLITCQVKQNFALRDIRLWEIFFLKKKRTSKRIFQQSGRNFYEFQWGENWENEDKEFSIRGRREFLPCNLFNGVAKKEFCPFKFTLHGAPSWTLQINLKVKKKPQFFNPPKIKLLFRQEPITFPFFHASLLPNFINFFFLKSPTFYECIVPTK